MNFGDFLIGLGIGALMFGVPLWTIIIMFKGKFVIISSSKYQELQKAKEADGQ